MTEDLKEALEWIETFAEREGLTPIEKDKAKVRARRAIDHTEENVLPKTIARQSIKTDQ